MSVEQREWRRAVRSEPIHISYEVWAVLRLVCKMQGNIEPGLPRMTESQLADEILLVALKEDYPEVFVHRKAVDKLEKELIKQIGANHDTHSDQIPL